MTIRAYDSNYLSKASRAVGAMLHDAVYQFGMDGGTFLDLFIQSGVAEAFESGSPKYIAGKSGLELYLEVMERTTGRGVQAQAEESYERSDKSFGKLRCCCIFKRFLKSCYCLIAFTFTT